MLESEKKERKNRRVNTYKNNCNKLWLSNDEIRRILTPAVFWGHLPPYILTLCPAASVPRLNAVVRHLEVGHIPAGSTVKAETPCMKSYAWKKNILCVLNTESIGDQRRTQSITTTMTAAMYIEAPVAIFDELWLTTNRKKTVRFSCPHLHQAVQKEESSGKTSRTDNSKGYSWRHSARERRPACAHQKLKKIQL